MAVGQVELPAIVQKVFLDTDGVSKGAADAESRVGNMTQKMSAVGGTLTKFVTLPIAGVGIAAFKMASDLNESISKVGVVFGKNSTDILNWSKTAATAMGMSQQQALEAAGTFGNLFRAMGLAIEPATSMSKSIVGLAADLASFNNANPDDVLLALRAGLVGETEPLRKFGVNINQARIEAEAFALGLVQPVKNAPLITKANLAVEAATRKLTEAQKEHGKGSLEARTAANELQIAQGKLNDATAGAVPELTAAQKAQAAYSLIMKDTKLAQGDFERTSSGAANQQRILAAQFKDTAAAIGQNLLPIGQKLLTTVNGWLTAFNNLSPGAQKTITILGGVAAAVGPVLLVSAKLINATNTVASAVKKLEVADKIGSAASKVASGFGAISKGAQMLWATLMANPIILIVAGIVALGAALYVAYQKVDWFHNAVDAAWQGIQTAFDAVWGAIKAGLDFFGEHWKVILALVAPGIGLLVIHFNTLKDVVTTVFNAVVTVIQFAWNNIVQPIFAVIGFTITTLVDIFQHWANVVTTVLGAIGTVISTVWTSVIQPVFSAIAGFVKDVLVVTFQVLQTIFTTVWNAIGAVASAIWNTVLSPVWNAMVGFIRSVLQVAWQTAQAVFTAVWNAISSVASTTWGAIKGVWDGIVSFVKGVLNPVWDSIKSAFSTAWEAVAGIASSVWTKIKASFSSGLRVIGDVVGGILKIVSGIARVVGATGLADSLLGAANKAYGWGEGMASGGTVAPSTRAVKPGVFARGGMMPYQEVGSGFITPGARAIVGEGRPQYPEYVVPTDPQYRKRARGLAMDLVSRLGGMDHYARGGQLGWKATPHHGIGDVVGGAWDATGGKVVTAAGNAVQWARGEVAGAVGAAWPTLAMANNMARDIPAGGMNKIRQGVIDFIKGAEAKKIASELGNLVDVTKTIIGQFHVRASEHPAFGGVTPGAHTPTSWHYKGRAVDMNYGPPGQSPVEMAQLDKVYSWIKTNVPKYLELLWRVTGHFNHLHLAMGKGGKMPFKVFDKGGLLNPGWNLAYNGTGRPEQVVAPYGSGGVIKPSRELRHQWKAGPGKDEWAAGLWRHEMAMATGSQHGVWRGFGTGRHRGGAMDRFRVGAPHVDHPGSGGQTVIEDGAFRFTPLVGDSVTPEDIRRLRSEMEDAFREMVRTYRMRRRRG